MEVNSANQVKATSSPENPAIAATSSIATTIPPHADDHPQPDLALRVSALEAAAGRKTKAVIEHQFGGDEVVDIDKILKMARQQYSLTEDRRFMRLMLCGLGVTGTIMTIAMFAVTLIAINLAKDSEIRSGQLQTLDGDTVQMASSEMVVTSDGTLVQRNDDSRRLAMCKGNKTCARRLQNEFEPQSITLATRDADLVPAELTSTMTEENLANLDTIAVNMFDEDGELVKNILQVTSFSRRIFKSSKCGTVVDFQTTWGMVMLDDYDLHATETFLKFAAARGLRNSLTEATTKLHTRRLNAAGNIVGFFTFVKQYDWKCDSVGKPLEKLQPPFAFAIQSLRACPDFRCWSKLLPNDLGNASTHLPGYQQDPHRNNDAYIAVTEEVFAKDEEMLVIRHYPNFPGMQTITFSDYARGTMSMKQVFNFNLQESVMTLEESATEVIKGLPLQWKAGLLPPNAREFQNFDHYNIITTGLKAYPGDESSWFQTFQIMNQSHEQPLAEFWENARTGLPHKYFTPSIDKGGITYFKDFLENGVDEELWSSLKHFATNDEVSTETTVKDVGGLETQKIHFVLGSASNLSEPILPDSHDPTDPLVLPIPSLLGGLSGGGANSFDEHETVLKLYFLLDALGIFKMPTEGAQSLYWTAAFEYVREAMESETHLNDNAAYTMQFMPNASFYIANPAIMNKSWYWAVDDENGAPQPLGGSALTSGRRLNAHSISETPKTCDTFPFPAFKDELEKEKSQRKNGPFDWGVSLCQSIVEDETCSARQCKESVQCNACDDANCPAPYPRFWCGWYRHLFESDKCIEYAPKECVKRTARQLELTVEMSDAAKLAFFSVGGAGKLTFVNGQLRSLGMELSLGVGHDFYIMEVSGSLVLTLQGSLNTDGTFKIAVGVKGVAKASIFGGLISGQISIGGTGTFDNLGPTFSGSDIDDDTVAVKANFELEATILWVFTITVSIEVEIIPEMNLFKPTGSFGASLVEDNCPKAKRVVDTDSDSCECWYPWGWGYASHRELRFSGAKVLDNNNKWVPALSMRSGQKPSTQFIRYDKSGRRRGSYFYYECFCDWGGSRRRRQGGGSKYFWKALSNGALIMFDDKAQIHFAAYECEYQ